MKLPNLFTRKEEKPVEPPQKKPHILVVDDEKYLNDFYVELLTSEGYTLTAAFNGQEALEIITQNKPNLILLDIMMPVMNGNELLAKLQEDEQTKKIPVIMLTNAGNIDNMATAKMYNTRRFFIKSNIIPEEIIQAVKELLTPDTSKGYIDVSVT